MRIAIVTIKPWNIDNALRFKQHYDHAVSIFTRNEEETWDNIRRIKPRYIFFPHWSWKIPKDIYETFECVGFHMTDLPYGRGGSPLQNLIVRGHKKTKISAFRITDKMDAGPIYYKEQIVLHGTAQRIYEWVSEIVFNYMIPKIVAKRIEPIPQEGQVVEFERRKPEDGDIQNCEDLADVYDYIRMLDAPDYPHAFIETDKFNIRFTEARNVVGGVIARAVITKK